ncbi:unnamed protein product, partial [Callosobruchus maculatus]
KPFGLFIRDTKLKRRAILKNGDYNILQPKFPNRYWNYLKDPYTSLVDAEWKWNLQAMAVGFLGWTPCVLNIYGFHSCFLYSLETQHTTGYGLRAITEECPEAIFLMCAQCLIGTIIDSFTVGAVIAKLTRPTMSNSTIMFTRNAVICLMDGTSISAILIHTKRTKEGDRFDNFQTPLELQCDDMGSEIFFLWPMTVVHKIDENSPFYNLSASQMLKEHFEIVKFVNLLSFNEKHQSYEANFKLFDKMEWVETPFCSAAEFEAQDSVTKVAEGTLELNGVDEETLPKDRKTDVEQELKNSNLLSRYEEVRDWEYCRHQLPIYEDIIYEEDEDEDGSDGRGDTPPFPNNIQIYTKGEIILITTSFKSRSKYAFDLQYTVRQCETVRTKPYIMKSAHRTFYLTRTILTMQNAKSQKLSRQITEDGGKECDIYSELDRQKELPLLISNNPNSFNKITGTSSYPRLGGLTRVPTEISIRCPGPTRTDSFRRSFRPNAVRKMRRRAVFKNGDCNILQSRISRRRLRYLQDIFTTLVDSQWRWTLTIFAIGFIAYTHGDLEEDHLPLYQADNNWTPCVFNIHGFTSCFLFSIETQHTIGYGVRTTTEECPEAIFIMCMQSISGMIIQSFMVGIVFAKMTRPKLRTQTLQFSRNAVVCQRDGHLCLMFRVGDMRKSHIIGASIRAQLIRAKKTKEGELSLNADACDGNLFFIWPMTVVHRIDENSPLYNLSASTVESTGQTTQARSSYVASEVLWGHRFEPVVSYNKDRQGYEVNYSKFDSTVPIDTPLCSGAELAEFYRFQRSPDSADVTLPCSDIPSP